MATAATRWTVTRNGRNAGEQVNKRLVLRTKVWNSNISPLEVNGS